MAACHVNMSVQAKLSFVLFIICLTAFCHGRIHNLRLQNDNRHQMTLSTFGFLKGGTLAVNITMFSYRTTSQAEINNHIFGFTLDKSKSAGLSNYVESVSECIWDKSEKTLESVFFKFDLKNKCVKVERNGADLKNVKITDQPREQYLFDNNLDHGVNLKGLQEAAQKAKKTEKKKETSSPATGSSKTETKKKEEEAKSRQARAAIGDKDSEHSKAMTKPAIATKAPEAVANVTTSTLKPTVNDKATLLTVEGFSQLVQASKNDVKPAVEKKKSEEAEKKETLLTSIPITETVLGSVTLYQSFFLMHVSTIDEEGLYNLFFHNCLKVDSLINLTLQIIEDNNGNYLSADEMPIPALYFVFSVVFLIIFFTWISVLRKADEGVYKIHYLMLVVVFFKSLSCLFHGINMYMIQKNGIHVDAWAILWYIVYLMRGALMFVTVLLIGAGWAFIKHMFTDREKRLFLIVMPLQILENVAWVIVEESEEGTSSYNTWNQIFMAVDLLCCFAILFPVIWSIRHLQEASGADGKVAINLNKLKLFRFFYILVVCYIYFTRIIVYLLKITLPFHYGWMRNLFAEVFLLCFFTLTGFKFRPTNDNPYLQVPQDSDEEDIEMDEVMTKTGNMDTLTRVNQNRGGEEELSATTVKQRESSHEYD